MSCAPVPCRSGRWRGAGSGPRGWRSTSVRAAFRVLPGGRARGFQGLEGWRGCCCHPVARARAGLEPRPRPWVTPGCLACCGALSPAGRAPGTVPAAQAGLAGVGMSGPGPAQAGARASCLLAPLRVQPGEPAPPGTARGWRGRRLLPASGLRAAPRSQGGAPPRTPPRPAPARPAHVRLVVRRC